MTSKRLDQLVATLASTRPTLDDATRARVARALEAAVRRDAHADEQPVSLAPHRTAAPASAAPAVAPSSPVSDATSGPSDDARDAPAQPATGPRDVGSLVGQTRRLQATGHDALADLPARDRSAAGPAMPRSRVRAIVAGLALTSAAVAGLAIWRSQQETAPAVGKPAPMMKPLLVPQSPEEVEAILLRVYRKAEPPVRDYAALRQEALDTLRASLLEAEPVVRVLGSDALGRIKDEPSIPRLRDLTEFDPDSDVRGHSGEALATIGATAAAPLLTRLEAAAPPPLKVWYASALARLGDKGAAKRLLGYARSKDLAVSFKAGLALAEISAPGDTKTIAALKALAAHEAELPPLSGALLLTKLAALRDAAARKVLTSLLDSDSESVRLAAAEGLARLGDDAGKQVLADVLANPGSPNRLVAAVAQIPLGEYGGVELLTEKLASKDADADTRRLAARALGEIGQPNSLDALVPLAHDNDWTVRIAAAGAIVAIVGPDSAELPIQAVFSELQIVADETRAAGNAFGTLLVDLARATATAPRDDHAVEHVKQLAGRLKTAALRFEAAAAKSNAAAKMAHDAACGSPLSVALNLEFTQAPRLGRATRGIQAARFLRDAAQVTSSPMHELIRDLRRTPERFVDCARLGVATKRFATAKANLDEMARWGRQAAADPRLDELYARTLLGLAGEASDPKAKRKLLEQAQDWCQRYAKHVPSEGNACSAEVTRELSALGPP